MNGPTNGFWQGNKISAAKLIIETSVFDPLNLNSNDLKTEFETAEFLIACKQEKAAGGLNFPKFEKFDQFSILKV